ncbi:MAG: hypothetical protein KOO63_12490, partial [Bacteroidales bacterium]|nr:hypothetical protein [Candidatus Latescibacterota bacterium]
GGSDGADEKSFTDANGDGFDDDYADRVRNDVGEGESTRTDLSSSADDGSRKHQRSGTEEFDGDLKVFGDDNDGTQDGDMVHRTQGPGFDNEDTQIGPNEGEEYFGEESDLGDGDMVHEQVRGGNGRK